MGVVTLVGQAAAMFFASLAVGMLPLVFKGRMSSMALESIQVFGMGLLVGAALTIIIPEGVETLYAADPDAHVIGIALLSGFALMLLIHIHTEEHSHAPPPQSPLSPSLPPSPSPLIPLSTLPTLTRSVENLSPHPPHASDLQQDPEHNCGHDGNNGIMHDGHGHGHGHGHDDPRRPILPKDDDCETQAAAHGLSATLGLVIHGAADGIAIGASSLTGNSKLSMVVFIAVIVHKGPAALGLATTLLSLHLSPAQVRRRLLIFSAAAPAGALVTYGIVKTFGGAVSGTGRYSLGWWTGAVLLFSGGSFLYVATVLQDISQVETGDHCHHVHHSLHNRPKMPRLFRTGLILAGMLLPLALSAVVGHHDH